MISMRTPTITPLFFVILGTLLLSLLGCQSILPGQTNNTPADAAPQSTIVPSHTPTPKPISTAADTIASNPEPTVITLSFWTVEQFSPQINLIAQTLSNFEKNNPNITVEVYQKKISGQASTLNYLKSAKAVAPGILPDVLILRTDQLPQAWQNNLIQPLNGKLDRTIVQDLLPAAQKLVTIDDQLVGIPLEMDVEHLVYNTSVITPTPMTWSDVLSHGQRYQFPAKGQGGLLNDASIIQYLGAGATFTNDKNEPSIDESALRAVLNYYQTALNNRILSTDILEASQPEDLCNNYLYGNVALTHVNAHTYLTIRRQLPTAQAAAIPTENGTPIAIGHGWALALVTQDPIRQTHALNLIEAFMTPETNAAWATYANTIPTRQSSFNLVADDDPYWAFLANYLTAVIAPPNFAGYDQLSRILQQAVVQVINGEATADEAVGSAMNALGQQ